MNNAVTIVMYHYVRNLVNSRYPKIKGLDLQLFQQQIEFFKENYNFITCNELQDAIERKIKLPEKSILLTFDDGYIDHYTNVLPILLENRIQGFFSMPGKIIAEGKILDVNKIHFVLASVPIKKLVDILFNKLDFYRGAEFNIPSNEELYKKFAVQGRYDDKDTVFVKSILQYAVDEKLRNIIADDLFKENISLTENAFAKELYMSYDQVKLMKKLGMEFGIHGYDHYWLGRLSTEKMKQDINAALDVFDSVIDRKNWIMCYPYGSYNEEIKSYIDKKGCKYAFNTKVKVADIDIDNKLELSRMDTNDFIIKRHNYNML